MVGGTEQLVRKKWQVALRFRSEAKEKSSSERPTGQPDSAPAGLRLASDEQAEEEAPLDLQPVLHGHGQRRPHGLHTRVLRLTAPVPPTHQSYSSALPHQADFGSHPQATHPTSLLAAP